MKSFQREHVANFITLSRIVFIPLFIFSLKDDAVRLFALAYLLHAIMDSADGNVARILKTQSDFGRKLDSIIDAIVYTFGDIIFVTFFASEFFVLLETKYYLVILILFLATLRHLVSYKYTKRPDSSHTYIGKTVAIVRVALVVTTCFTGRINYPLLYTCVCLIILSNIEVILMYHIHKNSIDLSRKSILSNHHFY
jgi:phosphatidylserine synthase